MEQMFKHTDIFLTHTWRSDLHNRDNHHRVAQVNEQLNKRGFVTWFDSKRMEGKIRDKMAEGVDFTSCVLVFVTEAYMQKLDSGDKNDNCLFEFNRAMRKKEQQMLCIVMEEQYQSPSAWFGKLKADLGDCLFMSMAGDLNNQLYLKKKMDELVSQLRLKSVNPSQIRMICPSCKIHDENNIPIPLYSEGRYCTVCKRGLVPAHQPKHYCGKCNLHRHGRYCNESTQDLLDPQIKITEIEDQYLKEIALKMRLNSNKLPPLAVKCEKKIEHIQDELHKLQVERTKAQSSDTKLLMNDIDYANKTAALKDAITNINKNIYTLHTSTLDCCKLESEYDNKIVQLKTTMKDLADLRNDISQRTSNFNRGFDVCVETSKLITRQFAHLKSYAAFGEADDLPNLLHDQECECELCIFESDLKAHLKMDGGRIFFQVLISNNRISDIKIAIKYQKDILHSTDENGLNLLMSLVLLYGTTDMLAALMEIGLQVDREELAKHVTSASGQEFIRQLISNDDKSDLNQLICVCKDILFITNEDGLNALFSLSVQYGSIDTLVSLLELGLQTDTGEFIKQMKLSYGKTFMKKLLSDSKTDGVKKLIYFCKESRLLSSNEGLHFIMSLSLKHRSIDLLSMLFETGFKIDTDELMRQMRGARGRKFIQKLISDNNKNQLKHFVSLFKEILNLTSKKGLNLLTSMTIQNGNFEMLATLLEAGLQIDSAELFIQLKHPDGQNFVRKIITDNRKDYMKQLVSSQKDILQFEDKQGVNQLIALTLTHGTIEMLTTLVETGLRIDDNDMQKQIKLEYGQSFIQKLISDNKTNEVRQLILLWKGVLDLKNDKRLNTLISMTLKHGTVNMLATLVDMGLQIDTDDMKHQIKLEYGRNFVKKLICYNRIDDLKHLILLWKRILHSKNDEGLNMLTSLTLEHGTINILAALVDTGLQFDRWDLTRQMNSKSGQNFLQKLIFGNKEDEVKKFVSLVSLQKHNMHIKNNKGLNLWIALLLQYGTVNTITALVDAGLEIDEDDMMKLIKHEHGESFIQKLITEDKTDDVKQLLSIWKELVHMLYENGFNILLYHTVNHGTLQMLDMLLDAGVKIEDTFVVQNDSLLHHTNSVEIAQVLCEKYGNILLHIKDDNGCTPFVKAYLNDNLSLLKILKPFVESPGEEIKCFEVFQPYLKDGSNYIVKLIEQNDVDTMKILSSHRRIIHLQNNGFNLLLSLTVQHGTVDILVMLLQSGIEVDAWELTNLIKGFGKRDFLQNMISHIKTDDEVMETRTGIMDIRADNSLNLLLLLTVQSIMEMLLEMGFSVDEKPVCHESLLQYFTRADTVQWLCETYGDKLRSTMERLCKRESVCDEQFLDYLTKPDTFEWRCRMYNHKLHPIKIIAGYNAHVNDIKGGSVSLSEVIEFCVKELKMNQTKNMDLIQKVIEEDDIVAMKTLVFLDNDIVRMEDRNKRTPFLICSEYGTLNMLELLINHGSDVEHCDTDMCTALYLAVREDNIHSALIVEHLCEIFPSLIPLKTNDKNTVFHLAAHNNQKKYIEILLDQSPPRQLLRKRNSAGKSPIDFAKQEKNKDVVWMFNEYLNEHKNDTIPRRRFISKFKR